MVDCPHCPPSPRMPGPSAIEPRVFPCIRCGACCRNLDKSPLLADLDRGDGVCRHLDTDSNLCRTYETRPKICRVSEMFSAFEEHMTWPEYVALNQQACQDLRARSYRDTAEGQVAEGSREIRSLHVRTVLE